jgi:hypothetical protein
MKESKVELRHYHRGPLNKTEVTVPDWRQPSWLSGRKMPWTTCSGWTPEQDAIWQDTQQDQMNTR